MKSAWLFFLSVFPTLSVAFPPSMDIGTFTIDNYGGNGGGLPDLTYQISLGQNFFAAANAQIPGYSASVATPGNGTSGPTYALDKKNTDVNFAAITNTSSGGGNREYCDFAYYGGHGVSGSLFLGWSPGYGGVFPANMNLGLGYNRFFMAHGCSIFKTASAPATAWQPAFKGLKAMLSFKSLLYDNHLGWELFNEFWLNWTYREKSLLNAFFDAETNYGYKHLYPTKGLEPGCLSAQVSSGTLDHCRLAFRYVAHDYTAATQNSGYYYSRVIGSPQY
jgi:hypothetical protein